LYIIVLAAVTTVSVYFAAETVHTNIGEATGVVLEREGTVQPALVEE
jgi:hypothetical protein